MKSQFYNEIKGSLKDAGLASGDLIFIQSSVIPFIKKIKKDYYNDFFDAFCDAIFDVLGSGGTVCFPVFSYSFFRNEVFIPEEPPKNSMGLLPVEIWSRKKCARTMDPLFSVAVCGALEKKLTEGIPKTCFGKNSFFDRFYKLNGKLLQIGISIDGTTFVIYFDQKLKSEYRYLKKFSGRIKIGNKLRKETWITYVRKLDGTVTVDLKNLKERVEQDGYIKKAPLMDGFIYSIGIRTLFKAVKGYFKEDPLFFLKH